MTLDKMIEWAREDKNRFIVVSSYEEKNLFIKEYKCNQFITFAEILSGDLLDINHLQLMFFDIQNILRTYTYGADVKGFY